MKKDKIIYRPDQNIMEYNGKKFNFKVIKYKKIDGIEHEAAHIFEEIDEVEYNRKLEDIKSKLYSKVNKERILDEVMKGLSTKVIDRIYKQLQDKKTKVKRHDGCLGLLIDGGKRNKSYIQLYD